MLVHAGFQEGFEESFHASGREGVSEALVFDSAVKRHLAAARPSR
jgi:hypothetical protein